MRTSKESEKDEIAGYWRDATRLAPLPDYFYVAAKGYGIRSMALKRVRCVGENNLNAALRRPAWVGVDPTVIWSGPEYKPHRTEVEQSKRYSYSKQGADVNLEDALARLAVFASEHEMYYEESLKQLAKREEELREQRAYSEERLEEARGFWLSPKDIKVK